MDKIFSLDGDVLTVTLPTGKTMAEINAMAEGELNYTDTLQMCFGKHIKVTGRCTTGLAVFLGHKLAHVCKSVSIFDPKENAFVMCVSH